MRRTKLMNILHYEIPREYQNRSDILVCHYYTRGFGLLAIVCVVLGLFFAIGMTYGLAGNMNGLEKLLFATMSIGVGVFSVAMGWMFVLYMKNWTVIFHDDGIWYRGIAGEIFNFAHEEVRGYTITSGPKHYYITLWTEQKRIWIDSASPNYYQAKKTGAAEIPGAVNGEDDDEYAK